MLPALVLMLLALAPVVASAGGDASVCGSGAAGSALNCSYNGVCKAGACVCSTGWRGAHCEQLDLLPAEGSGTTFTGATAGLNLLSEAGNWTSTWGGSVVPGRDGKFHMFAAMMLNQCGINAWLQNSVVLHAVSATATGSYSPRQIVAPVFSHEPIAAIAPTGETVLFYTTTVQLHRLPTVCKTCTDCVGGNSSMDCAPDWDARGRDWSVPLPTYMTYTKDETMETGWSKPVLLPSNQLGIDPSVDTNFAPVILANGSLVGVTRTASIVFAADWRDPKTYRCIAHPDPKTEVPDFGEDPNIWVDSNARFHILTHAHGGRHFFSADARTWHPAPTGPQTQAYPKSAKFTDGSAAPFGRRERPHLVFDANLQPVALTSAVTMPPTKSVGHPKQLERWPDASFTFLQPIRGSGGSGDAEEQEEEAAPGQLDAAGAMRTRSVVPQNIISA